MISLPTKYWMGIFDLDRDLIDDHLERFDGVELTLLEGDSITDSVREYHRDSEFFFNKILIIVKRDLEDCLRHCRLTVDITIGKGSRYYHLVVDAPDDILVWLKLLL